MWVEQKGKQEYSARTLGATWGIISAVMVPIMVVLVCIGWRLLVRRKAEEKEEQDFLTVKPIDPDESIRVQSDDDSIPYKKDVTEDSPEPNDTVKIVDNAESSYPYGQPYEQTEPAQQQPGNTRQWGEETEIN